MKDPRGLASDARDCRRSLRSGAAVQGVALRRAWRRDLAVRVSCARCSGTGWSAAFEAVKDGFDPGGQLNPGKIVRPYRMDDPALMRFGPGYAVTQPARTALDWGDPASGGFGGAVEMCNNNGTCRKLVGGGMCPSYRVTRDEQHLTRGRANTLRLAISGQLGPDAISSPELKESMALCVGCKACRHECPTGVDMAKMKIEVLHHHHARHGLPLRDRLVAFLPRYAPVVARLRWLANLRDRVPGLAWASRPDAGPFSAARAAGLARPRGRTPAPSRHQRMCVGDGLRHRVVRRHVQPLFRAGQSGCGDPRSSGGRLPAASCGTANTPTAVLRAHLSGVGAGRPSSGRG